MNFISVRSLATYFKIDFIRIDDELIEKIRNFVNQHFLESELIHVYERDFTLSELIFILDQLKEEKNRVFHDWIEQDFALSEYLSSNGETLLPNGEIILPKEHQLYGAYQAFLSTYLAPVLSRKINKCIQEDDLNTLGNHLQFSPLLPKQKRIELQQAVSSYLRQLLAQLKVSQEVNLQLQLKLIYSYSFVQVLNALDENFYSDAIAYIDTAKLIVQKNELNSLILDKIKSSISSLTLNKSHQKQVLDFCNSDAFTKPRNKPRSTLNNIVRSPLFFVVLIAVIINFIFFYPMDNSAKNKLAKKQTTGIDGLNPDELHEVDTMLGFKQDSIPQKDENLPHYSSPKYVLTANWDSIENTIVKELYANMIADYNIQNEQGVFYQCRETKKELYGKSLYLNVNNFSGFSTANQTISNKSNGDLYVLLFDPKKDGKVYGQLIAAGRSFNVHLKKGDQLIFYSGRQMNAFNPMRNESNGYGNIEDAKKVSKRFVYHFCGQNVYNYQQLNKIYEVEKVGDVVFEGVGNGFEVVFK